MYIPLHAHLANGSVGDSMLRIEDYIAKAKSLGMPAISMTDHGSMAAMMEFYDKCNAAGIKPIIGMEAYVTDDRTIHEKQAKRYYHLILLAKNEEGVKNLLYIHNDAQKNGFYYKPRTDLSVLKEYGKNIIATSACVGGEIPQLVLHNQKKDAIKIINAYKEAFDEFYLEIQPGHFIDQNIVNEELIYLAEITNTPLVVTNDIHYLNAKDYLAHNYHVQSSRKAPLEKMAYPDRCYYVMGQDELLKWFEDTPTYLLHQDKVLEAINNTVHIAEQCNGKIEEVFKMPVYSKLPEGITAKAYLHKLCYDSFEEKRHNVADPQKYIDAIEDQLDTIDQLGFNDYFLMVWDFIKTARSLDIAVGPGRGSCVNCVISWLLGISVVDPIKYNLPFARFLSRNRKGLPDIDIDIASDGRNFFQRYVMREYGIDNCAFINTVMYRKTKRAIRDAARMLGLDVATGDEIAKLVPTVFYDDEGDKMTDLSIEDSLKAEPKLEEYKKKYPKLFEIVSGFSGLPVSYGQHAAGVLISPESLFTKIPLRYTGSGDKEDENRYPVSCLTKEYVERFVIKFDFLSLATQKVIDQTSKNAGITLDLNNDEFYEDKEVWKTIGSKYTDGMFQISSSTYKARMPRLKPTNIQELANCLALVRGPCISAGTDELYMQICEGKKQVEHISPEFDIVGKPTNGVIIYQEQIMDLAVRHGMTVDDSYVLLKAASKKKIDKLKALESDFRKKATAKGISKEHQDKVFQTILDAGLYSFNMGHAMAYAVNCYISAYLKYHYPLQFFANLLTNAYISKKEDTLSDIATDCRIHGIEFLPLDINKSEWDFKAEEGKIRIGFCAVLSFGSKAANEVLAHRPYNSIKDIITKTEQRVVNKRVLAAAIYSGCLDALYPDTDRFTIYSKVCELKNADISAEKDKKEYTLRKPAGQSDEERLQELEIATLKQNYIHSPVEKLKPSHYNDAYTGDIVTMQAYVNSYKKTTDKNGHAMARLELHAKDAVVNCLVFHSVYDKTKKAIMAKKQYVKATLKKGDDIAFANKIEKLDLETADNQDIMPDIFVLPDDVADVLAL